MLETLPSPVHLVNDIKDDDNGTNNKVKNVVDAHNTGNKKKHYNHGQVNQIVKGYLWIADLWSWL